MEHNNEKEFDLIPEGLSNDTRMERIVVTVWNNGGAEIKKAFVGRWLVGDADGGISAEMDGVRWDTGTEYSIAETKKGQIAVYERGDDDYGAATLKIYKDFSQMKDATIDSGLYPEFPENIIAEVASALGRPYGIDLDI